MTWTDRFDRILIEAKQLTPGRALLTVFAAPFVMVGWLVGLVWTVCALAWTAVVFGVREAKAVADRTPVE